LRGRRPDPHIGFRRTLCPGSGNSLEYLVPKEGEPGALDLSTCARKMTIEEWNLLLEAWGRWPFKPDVGVHTELHISSLIPRCRRCRCYFFPSPLPKRHLWHSALLHIRYCIANSNILQRLKSNVSSLIHLTGASLN